MPPPNKLAARPVLCAVIVMPIRFTTAVSSATVSTATYLASSSPNRGTGAAMSVSSVPRSRSPAVKIDRRVDGAGHRHQHENQRNQCGQRKHRRAAETDRMPLGGRRQRRRRRPSASTAHSARARCTPAIAIRRSAARPRWAASRHDRSAPTRAAFASHLLRHQRRSRRNTAPRCNGRICHESLQIGHRDSRPIRSVDARRFGSRSPRCAHLHRRRSDSLGRSASRSSRCSPSSSCFARICCPTRESTPITYSTS